MSTLSTNDIDQGKRHSNFTKGASATDLPIARFECISFQHQVIASVATHTICTPNSDTVRVSAKWVHQYTWNFQPVLKHHMDAHNPRGGSTAPLPTCKDPRSSRESKGSQRISSIHTDNRLFLARFELTDVEGSMVHGPDGVGIDRRGGLNGHGALDSTWMSGMCRLRSSC